VEFKERSRIERQIGADQVDLRSHERVPDHSIMAPIPRPRRTPVQKVDQSIIEYSGRAGQPRALALARNPAVTNCHNGATSGRQDLSGIDGDLAFGLSVASAEAGRAAPR